ncbi:MAG TPA: hypothetical protein VFV99_08125 [Kofleriaceae bacterium]|nr:hypothetical protein [Kofleriaceae bacterium]
MILSLMFFAACSGDKDLATAQQCNPLGGAACITPWPSSLYEVDDPATTSLTHRRVEVPKGALPKNFDNIELSPDVFNKQDGWSYAAPPMIAFASGVDGSNLVSWKDIGKSITPDSPTVLINLKTGELVPHFAELDAREPDKVASQALYIRPAKLLDPGTQYAVAIKKTLKAKDGTELDIPEGFQAILDDQTTSHKLLEKIRPRFADIFAALEAKGIHKDDLVVAWDFTTRSRESVQADLYDARTATLAMTGTNGSALSFSVDMDTVPTDTRFARRIDGTFDAPLFLTMNGSFGPNIELVRDSAGKPMPTGLYRVPFTALIPTCAMNATAPVPLMIYGHGLLGKAADQVSSGGPKAAASEVCAVVFGTDMRGMSEQDVPNVALALNDGNLGHLIFDTLIQGMMNHVALVQIARGPMATQLFTKTPGGATLVDPSRVYYYGISQGGIFGGTVCGIDPVIKKCVLQVNAINYSMMLERSVDWPTYRTTLIGAYDDPLVVALMLNLMQQQWDRTDPVVVGDVLTTTGFPDTPAKQVLMQFGIADDQVPNVASEFQLRSMGLPIITPTPYTPYGATEAASAPSGVVIYDFGLGNTIPVGNEPPPSNTVHSNIRNKKATTDMMKAFYETGTITNLCTAPKGCDCTVADACGAAI